MSTNLSGEEKDAEGRGWRDERTLRTSATAEQLWDAWGDPRVLKEWFPDDARGSAVEGGEIVHVWKAFGMEVSHKVLTADRPRRLLLESISRHGAPFLQEVLIDREEGETVLRLVHSGSGDEAGWGEDYEGIDSGWKMAFALLRLFLEQHWGRSRHSFTLMQPAQFALVDAYGLFSTDDGLSRWFGKVQGMGGIGSQLDLELPGGETVRPEVLADTGLEVLISWPPAEGALELKAFPMGPAGNALCLRGHSWSGDSAMGEDFESLARAAFARLLEAI